MTFDDVPPGAQPTRITPIANSAGSWKTKTKATAMAGMITYWATTPSSTGNGRLATSAKSGRVRVIPMANMMIPRATEVYWASGAVWVGKKNPMRNATMMIAGNRVTAMRAERSSPSRDAGAAGAPVSVLGGTGCVIVSP